MAAEQRGVPEGDSAVLRPSRLHEAASEIRIAIARAGDAREMLAVACRVAVDVAGYRMAYAGLIDTSSADGDFVVVASAGDDFGWVAGVRAALNPDVHYGRTVGGLALRGGRTIVIDDLAAEPITAHRAHAARAHGMRSMLMLPLHVAGRLMGGMAVYATGRGAFGTAEVALLERTLDEIGFELERLERDEQLRASEERYRLLVEEASDAMLVVGQDGRFLDANEAAARLTGHARKDLLAMRVPDLAFPEDAPVVPDELDGLEVGQVLRASRPIRHSDGSPLWVELTATRLHDGRVQALLRDITARRDAEARADRLLHLYAATADIDRAIRGIMDRETLFGEACRVAVQIGGFRLATISLVDELDPVRPVDVVAERGSAVGFAAETARVLLNPPPGTPPMASASGLLEDRSIVLGIDDADDPATARRFDLLSAAIVPLHVGTEIVGSLAVYAGAVDAFGRAEVGLVERIADDVSFRLDAIEREEARRSAEAERDRLALAVEQASDAVFIATVEDGMIIYVNGAFEQLTGQSATRMMGTPAGSWLTDAESGQELLGARAKEAASVGWSGEVTTIRRDGARKRVAVSTTPLRDRSGSVTHVVTIMRDVTSRHELEEQLRQAQKMEAVGRLAGGVAHDFNNLLTAILGFASLARMELGDSPVTADIAAIEHTAERAADLTRQLLAFAHQSPLVRSVFAPDDLLTDLAPMLRRLIGEDVELEIARPGAVGRITGDATQLQQAIVNLVVNALDAMPQGGVIRLATADVDLDAGFVALTPGAAEGPHVRIAVSDTGSGIPPDIVSRIFDPFFTTKEVGRGTGLGLSMVLGTVQAAGGCIAVDSEPGRGTTFRIYLPRTEDPTTLVPGPAASVEPGLGVGRTLLVIEDEDMVRAFAVRMLEQAGFTVIEARDGNEALARVERHQGALDLIVTDVVMPGPTGPVTVERIRALRPGVPALFVTGYASRSITSERGLGTAVLQKPYRRQALLERIEALLEEGPATRPGV